MSHGRTWLDSLSGRLKSCFHMRKLGDIARSQDQTDIGVNNEVTGAGHSIGVASFSDFNVGNDFANVLKVDLSDKDTDDVARKGLNRNGDSHVRFRAPNQIDRTKIGSTLPALEKSR